jgi:hypothetical protein
MAKGQPGWVVLETPSQPIAGCNDWCLPSHAAEKVELRKISVSGQLKQKKICETSSQQKKADGSGILLLPHLYEA